MSNKNVSLTSGNNKQAFTVVNPSNGKILAFINFSQYVDESTANGLTAVQLAEIISKCEISKFVKSASANAFDGLL